MVNPRIVVSKTSYVRLESMKVGKRDTLGDVVERLLDEHDASVADGLPDVDGDIVVDEPEEYGTVPVGGF